MKTIHLVSILDRSGSMSGTEKEVIGAYNGFIEDQKKLVSSDTNITCTLVLFDDRYECVYSKVSIFEVPKLDERTYFVRGFTGLYDAIGRTIADFEGEKSVIFFIETDGQENASKEFTSSSLHKLIDAKKLDGWDFNFAGADLSKSVTTNMSAAIGIDSSKTIAFAKGAQGYATRSAAFAESLSCYIDQQ